MSLFTSRPFLKKSTQVLTLSAPAFPPTPALRTSLALRAPSSPAQDPVPSSGHPRVCPTRPHLGTRGAPPVSCSHREGVERGLTHATLYMSGQFGVVLRCLLKLPSGQLCPGSTHAALRLLPFGARTRRSAAGPHPGGQRPRDTKVTDNGVTRSRLGQLSRFR